MVLAAETVQAMQLIGQVVGLALTVLVLMISLARLAASFINIRL